MTDEKPFYNLSYDRVFKSVVLDILNRRYLNGMLTDILEKEVKVKEIEYSELPMSSVRDKVQVLDILLLTKDQKRINVELNSNFDEYIKERNLMYYFRLLLRKYKYATTMGRSGDSKEEKEERERWENIDEVVQINLDFNHPTDKLKRVIKLIDNYGQEYYDKFKIITVNIAGYKKLWYDKNIKGDPTHQELTLLGANKEEIIALGKTNEILKKVGEKVLEMNEDVIKQMQLEQERDFEYIYRKRMEDSENKGLEKGIQEGLEKGIQEGLEKGIYETKINTAKKLLSKGMSTKEISEILNLKEEEIINIQKEM